MTKETVRGPGGGGPKVAGWYRGVALLILNSLVLLVLLNILIAGLEGAGGAVAHAGSDSDDLWAKLGPDRMTQVYPGWARDELSVVQETRRVLPQDYESFT